jgi:hypothetical protein
MHGLAIVTMTEELRDGLSCQLELHGATFASDDNYSLIGSHDWTYASLLKLYGSCEKNQAGRRLPIPKRQAWAVELQTRLCLAFQPGADDKNRQIHMREYVSGIGRIVFRCSRHFAVIVC